MNKKLMWFVAFLIVGALSCWLTASSYMLIIPLPWYVIWSMTIVFFVVASAAYKMIVEAIHNDGTIENPKAKLWGGIGLLFFTWVIVSLPTNAHTFFYKLQINNVITQDLKTTEVYTTQLAKKQYQSVQDTARYNGLCKSCQKEMTAFKNEATGTGHTGRRYINRYALQHIHNLNQILGQYRLAVPEPNKTHNDNDTREEIMSAEYSLTMALNAIDDKEFRIDTKFANQAREDLDHIKLMREAIDSLVMTGQLSSSSAEPYIKQTEGVLSLAYNNIKMHKDYVRFNSEEDRELYTATNLETHTSRFMHPYKVMGDFFSGKIPFIFAFWLILSILLDVVGFFTFAKATNNDDF